MKPNRFTMNLLLSLFITLMITVTGDVTPHLVEATVYHAVPGQTDDTPDITASGARINLSDPLSHRWIAVSADLEALGYTFGRKVSVSGADSYDGIWIVQDRMNSRWNMRIDFLTGVNDPMGKWDDVIINLII